MKTVLAAILVLAATQVASAQSADPQQPAPAPGQTIVCCHQEPGAQPAQAPQPQPAPQVAAYTPAQDTAAPVAPAAAPAQPQDAGADEGWKRPVGRRFMHGFRLGWTYIRNYDTVTDIRHDEMGQPTSIKDKYGLKSPNMMLLGYEGFYRIVGHSWLNVLMVGNVTVAGLEQSKFIPAASGLIGFEFDRSFQLGVGVNLTPDPDQPSHMIAAAGWTPMVGSIQTPVHFFFVPDTEGNHRMGATVGMTW
jgi:hypothetical protein